MRKGNREQGTGKTNAPAPRLSPGKIGLGLAAIAGVGLVAGSLTYAWFATHPPRLRVRAKKARGLPIEPVTFLSRDGLKISGWFIPAENAVGAIILCHGHPANRMEMLPRARTLHPAGFHLLLFDFRSLGESEGKLCSIGLHETQDLQGAADYLFQRTEMRGLPLGVYGISMGGAVAIMTAAKDDRFAAVATHGAYADLDTAITQRGRMILGPLGRLFSAPTAFFGRRWLPCEPRHVSPVMVIEKIAPRPILIFHGARDISVNPADGKALYAAAEQPKSLRILPRSWHITVHPSERAAYDRELIAFFQGNLNHRVHREEHGDAENK